MGDEIRVAVLDAPPPEFSCGREELDAWLERHGLQATRAGSARVYLAHRDAELVGYLALGAASIDPADAGSRTRKGMPRHPIPAVRLARLAVATQAQGQGVGRELVRHAGVFTLRAARLIAVRALVVDAIDEPTAAFYVRVGFTPIAHDPVRLEILVKDLDDLFGERVAG